MAVEDDSLGHEDCQTILENPDHKGVLPGHTAVLPYSSFASCLQSETNVKLDTRSPSHLGESMSSIDYGHRTLHVTLGQQRGVQGRVAYGGGELTMS